jgi:hypothetical protein
MPGSERKVICLFILSRLFIFFLFFFFVLIGCLRGSGGPFLVCPRAQPRRRAD